MFSVLSVFEIAIVKLLPTDLICIIKRQSSQTCSLLFRNLLIIDRPHWKYWINYYHLSSIINKRQLEWIGSLYIDNNPQRFEGIEVIPAISSQLRWSRNKTDRTRRLYYVDDRRSGPDDEMIQREQHVRRDLDTTMTARSIVGELP